jgi:hypothetical protein
MGRSAHTRLIPAEYLQFGVGQSIAPNALGSVCRRATNAVTRTSSSGNASVLDPLQFGTIAIGSPLVIAYTSIGLQVVDTISVCSSFLAEC